MSVGALMRANPGVGDRLAIPQTCKQAEISVTRLSAMRHGADSCSCLSIWSDGTVRSVHQRSARSQNQAVYMTEPRDTLGPKAARKGHFSSVSFST